MKATPYNGQWLEVRDALRGQRQRTLAEVTDAELLDVFPGSAIEHVQGGRADQLELEL